ncbi:hypothetical protein COCNU_14G010190 [Cocos nucifera]|uniref:Uncharacterized protein n=1 Tax=Cocos nucifera TaxID=13894 RepID=A0A8K0IVN6_COCNU|nr:hypothetical protein COCNU_14G010190 [Cocos nucifera]
MSNLVGIWMQVFARLDKKQASAGSCNVESGGRRCTREPGEPKEELLVLAKQQGTKAEERRKVTLSDATVCMLMDRFAPG